MAQDTEYKIITILNNFHKKTEQILTCSAVLHLLVFFFFRKFKIEAFTMLRKAIFTLAGHYNTSFTRVWWTNSCSPVKKSAKPLTSSCAPSVTGTAPTWDCQTAASMPRYCHHRKMFQTAVFHCFVPVWKMCRLTVNLGQIQCHNVFDLDQELKLNIIYCYADK